MNTRNFSDSNRTAVHRWVNHNRMLDDREATASRKRKHAAGNLINNPTRGRIEQAEREAKAFRSLTE